MPKLTSLTSLSATPSASDKFVIVDVSDTSQGATGSTKALDADYVVLADGSSASVTGGGTIALGGYTVTFSDGATIDLSGGTLTITAGNVTFTTGGTLDLNSQTLTLTASTGGGTLNLNGRTFTVATGNVTLTGDAAGVNLTVSSSGTLDLNGNALDVADGNVNLTAGTLDLNGETLTVTATTGGGTLNLAGYTLTMPKTGTVATGTGTSGRVASWSDTNTLAAATLAKSGAGVLTLSAGSAYTLTVPKTGTVPVGTGTDGRVAKWSGDANTLAADTLAKTGAGVLTLAAASDYTATVASTGTVAMTSDIVGSPVVFPLISGAPLFFNGTVSWASQPTIEVGDSSTNVTWSDHISVYIDKSWFSGTWNAKLVAAWTGNSAGSAIYLRDLTNASDIISEASATLTGHTFTSAAGANLSEYVSSDFFSSMGSGGAWYGFAWKSGASILNAYIVLYQS